LGGIRLSGLPSSPCAPASRIDDTGDLTIFRVGLICSLTAGVLLSRLGWQTLNVALLPWLVLAAAALLWLAAMRRPGDAGATSR